MKKLESTRQTRAAQLIKKHRSSLIVRKILLFSTLVTAIFCLINIETMYSAIPSKLSGLGSSFYHEISSVIIAITGKEDANAIVMIQYILAFISYGLLALFSTSIVISERKGYNAAMEEDLENSLKTIADNIQKAGTIEKTKIM